jgi:hypothetical protein
MGAAAGAQRIQVSVLVKATGLPDGQVRVLPAEAHPGPVDDPDHRGVARQSAGVAGARPRVHAGGRLPARATADAEPDAHVA